MGFDLSGEKPKIRRTSKKKFPMFHIIDKLAWDEQHKMVDSLTDEDRKKYYKEMDGFYDHNPGVYFRNNCWWWRPLWNYVCDECKDILTEEDMTRGSYNDGHLINEKKAKLIADRLNEKLKSKEVDTFAKAYEKERQIAKKSDDKDLKFMSSYPFNVDNVKRFMVFCKESGGFVIC